MEHNETSHTFKLGLLRLSQDARAEVDLHDAFHALIRHARGDWGDFSVEQTKANDSAIGEHLPIISRFHDRNDTPFWIVTAPDRLSTHIVIPTDGESVECTDESTWEAREADIAEAFREKQPKIRTSHSEEQARAHVESIVEMVQVLNSADDAKAEEAERSIYESPLSIEVRSDWVTCGKEMTPGEYCILLCTGGPAVRLVGTLDENGEPDVPRVEHQDWFTPWVELVNLTENERAALCDYVRRFYFGQ